MSITAALPEPRSPIKATAQSDMDDIFTRIQIYHCSMKAKLRSTWPAIFKVITTASSKILDLLNEDILPASNWALSTKKRIV